MEAFNTLGQSQDRTLVTNRLIRNTYTLLALTLAFSALMAGVAIWAELPSLGLLSLPVYFGLLYLTTKFRNSSAGIVCVFALTGFMGATLGPILSYYLSTAHGATIVMQALGGTALVFFALSAYALTTRKDFSFMGGFLFVGVLVAFVGGIAAVIFSIPALSLAVSAAFILLSSGLILYQTSAIVNGGETNYIMATVTLYVAIYNLFVSLLNILGAFSGDD
jgi:modulator of FtsH protease